MKLFALIVAVSWLVHRPSAKCEEVLVGSVIDCSTQEPIPFVQLTISQGKASRSVELDYEGAMLYFDICPGLNSLHFQVDGYRSRTVSLTLPVRDKVVVCLTPNQE